VKTKRGFSQRKLLAQENRGLLLDIVVFILNLFLMQRLTHYAIDLFAYADNGEPLAQFSLLFACVAMWALPAAGAVLKRWHFHQRMQASGKKFDWDASAAGCLFNPLFYFCLNLVLLSGIIAGAGQFLFGNRLADSAAVFVPSILIGLIATIVQTYLIYRYFSPPKKPPRQEFLRRPESAILGDVCIFLNMILFQIVWNLLAFADLGRPSGALEFAGRLFFLCFVALLIYFPPRMFYLAEDIGRPRTWATMLIANSPVIVRVLIGTKQWQ
jgi:hypothetical protein